MQCCVFLESHALKTPVLVPRTTVEMEAQDMLALVHFPPGYSPILNCLTWLAPLLNISEQRCETSTGRWSLTWVLPVS